MAKQVKVVSSRGAIASQMGAAIAAKQKFTADLSTVLDAFKTTMLFDFKAIGDMVNAYAGKAEFDQMRIACFELAIKTRMTKDGVDCDDALAHEIAIHNATDKEARKLTEDEKLAKKSARNAWFGFSMKCGIITQEARGGANNATGKNGAKKKGAAKRSIEADAITDDDDSDTQDDAPVVVEAMAVIHAPSLMELGSHYVGLKYHLIKLQHANAKLYKTGEGTKLLDKHQRILAILNEA